MERDKIKQFEIALLELNRNLSYKNKDEAVLCYNKLHKLYNGLLNTEINQEQKHKVYETILKSHKRLTAPEEYHNQIDILEIVFLTSFLFLISIILSFSPEITGLLIAQQHANLVKPIYMMITVFIITLPLLLIATKKL